MAQALKSAQESLQQAGQQTAQGGQQGGQGQQESSEAEMGQEISPSGQPGEGDGGDPGGSRNRRNSATGMGNAGIGQGGRAGPQQPLPGVKKERLVKGAVDPRGQKLSRSYMGTPDPTRDKAAYYSIVPDKVRAAESALNREEIPAGYKKTVRDYFDSIQGR